MTVKLYKPTGMFPTLHDKVQVEVSNSVSSAWFQDKDTDRGSNHEWDTHVMGNFICNNAACSSDGWGSKKIAILIRGYPNNGYNAVVFNQRCRSCERLGTMFLDEQSYVDRVSRRVKIWAGLEVEPSNAGPPKGDPHEASLCEGCKRGHCSWGIN